MRGLWPWATERKLSGTEPARKPMVSVAALVVAAGAFFGLTNAANAATLQSNQTPQKIWEQAIRKNNFEGYSAFMAAFPEEAALAAEARRRAINALGEFDDAPFMAAQRNGADVPEAEMSGNVLLASNEPGAAYQAPYGQKRFTYQDIYVNDQGFLVDKDGHCVTPTGQPSNEPYAVTSSSQLRAPNGATITDDAAIRQGDLSQNLIDQGILGRLTVGTRDLGRSQPSGNVQSAASTTGVNSQTAQPAQPATFAQALGQLFGNPAAQSSAPGSTASATNSLPSLSTSTSNRPSQAPSNGLGQQAASLGNYGG